MNTIPYSVFCALALAPAAAMGGITSAPVDKNPASPAGPCAGPVSYTHVELLYQYTDFHRSGFNDAYDNGNGAAFRFEYEVAKPFYLTGDAEYVSYELKDGSGFDGDLWKLSLGIGGHVALTEKIHLAGDAGMVHSNNGND